MVADRCLVVGLAGSRGRGGTRVDQRAPGGRSGCRSRRIGYLTRAASVRVGRVQAMSVLIGRMMQNSFAQAPTARSFATSSA